VVVVLVLVAGGLLLAATVVFTFPCSVPQNAAALLRNRAVAACGAMSSDQRFFAGVFGYGGFAAALAAVASGIRFALTGRREDLLYGFIVVMMLLAGIQLAGLYAYA
jgi:hypothetical protein